MSWLARAWSSLHGAHECTHTYNPLPSPRTRRRRRAHPSHSTYIHPARPVTFTLPTPLLQTVENWESLGRLLQVQPEDEVALRSAQAIIARLRRRDLYKYVTDALVPQVGGVASTPACCGVARPL